MALISARKAVGSTGAGALPWGLPENLMLKLDQTRARVVVSANDLQTSIRRQPTDSYRERLMQRQTLWATQDNLIREVDLPIRRGWPGDLACPLRRAGQIRAHGLSDTNPRPCQLPRGNLRGLLRPVVSGVTPLIFPNAGGPD